MSIYVNRVLNMKNIKAIGFDMDHTLVRYHTEQFEELTFFESIEKLIKDRGYPEEIRKFKFDFNLAIRGLIVDKINGNVLKVSLYNKIKTTFHGSKPLSHKQQHKIYQGSSVDIGDPQYMSIDTAFSIAHTILFMRLIDLKDAHPELNLPVYAEIADDTMYAVDIAHRDGSLKEAVKKNLEKYVIKDEQAVVALERLKKYGKRLWIVTNSDYNYTRALLDYTINPFLKESKDWTELFEVTITLAFKPRFFTEKIPFLEVNPETELMENFDKKLTPGIYQGGYASKLEKDMGLPGSEILYLGDHIYGDIVKLKKSCDWRTALVLEELDKEVNSYKSTKDISVEIDNLMTKKITLEKQVDELYAKEHEHNQEVLKEEVFSKFNEIEKIDKQLGTNIKSYESKFNPYWGEVLRAGVEPSIYASQIERYACIYMTKIADFNEFSPRTYYRPKKRKLAHEL